MSESLLRSRAGCLVGNGGARERRGRGMMDDYGVGSIEGGKKELVFGRKGNGEMLLL